MSILSKLMKDYQNSNPEKFNEDLLTIKKRDNEQRYLEIAMKSLNCLDGIQYIKMEQCSHKIFKSDPEKNSELTISIDRSKLKIYRFYFDLEKDDKKETVSFEIYYPELIKDQYFLINDNRYFPVYQMLDSSFFNTKNGVVLKTLITPLSMVLKDDSWLELNVFNKKINPFDYFLAKFGFEKTLEFFKIDNNIIFSDVETDEIDNEKYTSFKINKHFYLYIDKEDYNKNYLIYNTLMKVFNSRSRIEKLEDDLEWKKKLGGKFTSVTDVNKKINKGLSTLVSLERSLDDLNKEILRFPKEDKKDIYSLLRYMMFNYTKLKKRSNCSLSNKRIRSHEYMTYPLFKKFTAYVRRLNNSKIVTFEKLHDFIPGKGILIKAAINNDLLRYDGSCNSIGVINRLRLSQGGPQSQFSSGSVNVKYRVNHPSYVGRIDLLATSASSPGCNLMLTPFCKLKEDKYFTDLEDFEEDE